MKPLFQTLAALVSAVSVFADDVASPLAAAFQPPTEFAGKLGGYRSPLVFDDGSRVAEASEWPRAWGSLRVCPLGFTPY